MKGGRSAMLQTFPEGGMSAMLQIFRGEGLQCCRPSGGKVCKGEDLQYNTGTNVRGANVIALPYGSVSACDAWTKTLTLAVTFLQ